SQNQSEEDEALKQLKKRAPSTQQPDVFESSIQPEAESSLTQYQTRSDRTVKPARRLNL
ncbi:hypothetical protein SK128_002931, partial [Halocaridina rubra]